MIYVQEVGRCLQDDMITGSQLLRGYAESKFGTDTGVRYFEHRTMA